MFVNSDLALYLNDVKQTLAFFGLRELTFAIHSFDKAKIMPSGYFRTTFEYMQRYTGLENPEDMKNCLIELDKKGFIKYGIVEKKPELKDYVMDIWVCSNSKYEKIVGVTEPDD